MTDLLFDFDNPGDSDRSLKRVAQAMLRAGQPVVSSSVDQKILRTSSVSYRQAVLTLASGQAVTLMVKLTGDVFRVLLNGASLPIKNQDGLKAIAEIAAAAERNQAKFQAAKAKQKVELPKGIRTAAPRMAAQLQARNDQLDQLIAERTQERDALKAELGETVLDAVSDPFPRLEPDGLRYNRDQYDLVPLDEHGELPPGFVLKPDAVPVAPAIDDTALDAIKKNNQKGYAFYVVVNGKIESGWEHMEDAKEHKADNMAEKFKATAKVFKLAGLKAKGIDPEDDSTWLTSAALDAVGMDAAATLAASVTNGEVLDSVAMGAAIATLQNALHVVETNHPINLAAGNVEQAQAEEVNATSFRQALAVLEGAVFDSVVLTDAATEVLGQVAKAPVEDGDLVSKQGRDDLIDAGFIDRYTDEGDNVINDQGRKWIAANEGQGE